eukprot:CAMPEP_0204612454 /NCGR_PEP_ID=MMETSP0717-20131115/540_1 /ASSEMBLY_ACC=CAM_ASM_000666 /TAXON_ID=230516 /ORGANISM="Chaetoceros curvisetus" /LENGTH=187 /DNA_ID=CAMNT_0051624545 /DNA_START=542 /DNA_END=1105 /DNA_ORIENTATION=-
MEMLLSTNAKIITFEPHPRNLFAMQNSIAALDQQYQDRVVIVPVALGGESAENIIYAAEGNMGNSNIGMIVRDNRKQVFQKEEQHTIRVERLDSIISSEYSDIAVMKLDAEGFECHILEGIGQDLANKLQKVKFEVDQNHLGKQKCTDLLTRFRDKGFDIKTDDEKKDIGSGDIDQFNRKLELIAVR